MQRPSRIRINQLLLQISRNRMAVEKIGIHGTLAFDVDQSPRLEVPFIARRAREGVGHVDPSRQTVRFHPAGDVYVVAPEVIGKLVLADHPRDDRAGMDADPQAKVRMPRGYRFDVHLHGQSHFVGCLDVVRTRFWNTCDNHIGVADGFYLLQAKAPGGAIETEKYLVQHTDKLLGIHFSGISR
jgi:hypothetical protein